MAWHKQKQYDPTEAFLANNKQQQLLEIKLKDIDKLWIARLKYYAKDRLESTADLLRILEDKRHLDHYDERLNPDELKQYTDHIAKVMKISHKELTGDNFDFDKYKRRRNFSISISKGSTLLPRLDKAKTEINFQLKRESVISKSDLKGFKKGKKSSKSSKSSKGSKASVKSSEAPMLLTASTRFISMSDTDLYQKGKLSKPSSSGTRLKRSSSDLEQRLKTDLYKKSKDFKLSRLDLESILRVADVNSPPTGHSKSRTQSKNSRKLPLLEPKKMVVSKDDHRYLKQHMVNTALPPLSEDSPKRKMSC